MKDTEIVHLTNKQLLYDMCFVFLMYEIFEKIEKDKTKATMAGRNT